MTPAEDAIERVVRESYGRLVAWLVARWRDVAAVEDALSEALATALRRWPVDGLPERPEAWLLSAAHRRLIDAARHMKVRAAAAPDLADLAAETSTPMTFPDERLPLLFVCAHPALAEDVRAPLMLQTVLGLDASRIAAAWLTAPATMAQRLVRAKTKIRDARLRFEVPEISEMPARLEAVLEAIYAAYATGWADPLGQDARTATLAREAIWLARTVADLLPGEPEADGLLALLLHCEARRKARRDAEGRYVPLSGQDVRMWDHSVIEEAEQRLAAAFAAGRPGRFQWEAAIQSAHAARRRTGATDWPAIVRLYGALLETAPTLGAAVAAAWAVTEADGAAAGLSRLEALPAKETAGFQPYWSVRAEVLKRLGRWDESAAARERARALADDPAVRAFLDERPKA